MTAIDIWLFRAMNGTYTLSVLDVLMVYVTQKSNFLGVIVVAAVLILLFGKKKDRVGLLLLVLVVATSDAACNFFKHLFMRVRPCHALEGVRLLVGCGGSYSMPSGHATNIFAAMVFLSLRYRKGAPFFLIFALMVAYSRVYVGVHYPADIFVGALLGTGIAFFYSWAEKKAPEVYRARMNRGRETG
ncbi:MAG: phosphatase PAP2 family protein [Thermodesulfobacteriota bacterium]|nr:MAG: phosphatase PAP2 family protein [Thermodesulfobacteriota bacterium]